MDYAWNTDEAMLRPWRDHQNLDDPSGNQRSSSDDETDTRPQAQEGDEGDTRPKRPRKIFGGVPQRPPKPTGGRERTGGEITETRHVSNFDTDVVISGDTGSARSGFTELHRKQSDLSKFIDPNNSIVNLPPSNSTVPSSILVVIIVIFTMLLCCVLVYLFRNRINKRGVICGKKQRKESSEQISRTVSESVTCQEIVIGDESSEVIGNKEIVIVDKDMKEMNVNIAPRSLQDIYAWYYLNKDKKNDKDGSNV